MDRLAVDRLGVEQLTHEVGVNITAFGRKLTLFLAPSRFPAFNLQFPAFLAYFELEKMRSIMHLLESMLSDQRQVELRRLGNQFPVLDEANSLCTTVNVCVCLPAAT